MIDLWTIVRFLHVIGAALWVGGQLTITLVLVPPLRGLLGTPQRTNLLKAVGQRFALITMAVFLPTQITTGILLAAHHGVTWASLLEPGYGRLLFAKLALFTLVMAAASAHGIAQGKGRPQVARAASIAALTGSLGVILLATALATH